MIYWGRFKKEKIYGREKHKFCGMKMGAGWALPHDLTRCCNEIWGGIPWSSFFATFAFFAA
jgi:hypothetical protein